MNKLSRGDSIAREIEAQTRLATSERNPLQKAYDDYHEMERQRDLAIDEVASLTFTNNSLLAELTVLRESFERSENNRVRFQSISATLLGRLLAINDCIAGAVKASVEAGIEPQPASLDDETEEHLQAELAASIEGGFSEADREAVERYAPKEGPKTPTEIKATPEPPEAAGGGLPKIQWH
jgi:hypothetical protein